MKKVTHKLPDKDFAYGLVKPKDPEGARAVTMTWVAHKSKQDDKTGPDFLAMNKLAAACKSPSEVRKFRETNDIRLKKIDPASQAMDKTRVPLPSDDNPEHTFGRPSAKRTIEEERMFGDSPSIKHIVQGEFMHDWVNVNEQRKEAFNRASAKIEPRSTRATQGHAVNGAKAKAASANKTAPFKMTKFSKVTSKLAQTNAFGTAGTPPKEASPAAMAPPAEA